MSDERDQLRRPAVAQALDLLHQTDGYPYAIGWLLPRLDDDELGALVEELQRLRHEQAAYIRRTTAGLVLDPEAGPPA